MPSLLPATTPMIWVKTRMAGTNVWTRIAARGPYFFDIHPVTNRFIVPVHHKLRSVTVGKGLSPRRVAEWMGNADRKELCSCPKY